MSSMWASPWPRSSGHDEKRADSDHQRHELPLPTSADVRARQTGTRRAAGRARRIMLVTTAVCLLTLVSLSGEARLFVHFVNRLSGGLPRSTGRTNVIFMVSDGYGPAGATLGRSFMQYVHEKQGAGSSHASRNGGSASTFKHFVTPLDKLLVGTHRSRSFNSIVTDSAAGATAFACGLKTNNYAIGVDQHNTPCGTLLEGAKEHGMLTGVVVTTRITDATPGSFFAHVTSRGYESAIANEVLGLDGNGTRYRNAPLDLAVGGGGCYFLPRSDPRSCRDDDIDLVEAARSRGWATQVLFDKNNSSSRSDADILTDNVEVPYLGLLAPSNTPYVIDRPASMPGLPTLSTRALNALQRSSQNRKGFFIMIEGSQIDLCGHQNDPACQVHEVTEYQETVARVVDWAERSHRKYGDRTLIVSTSDHETGGLDLALQETEEPVYAYYPERLFGVKHSSNHLGMELVNFAGKIAAKASAQAVTTPDQGEIVDYIRTKVLGADGANFTADNGGEPSDDEVSAVLACLSSGGEDRPGGMAQVCQEAIAKRISRRANLGWSTHGHTGVDVNVYATGEGSHAFRGNRENIELGHLVAKHLGIDLKAVTRRLHKQLRHRK